jgi:catechol 2,3-dioxygenase
VSALIRRMGHVAMSVPDLDRSVAWATTVMGMRETERVDGTAYLSHTDCHHSLQLRQAAAAGLDHVAMEAHDEPALDSLVSRLTAAGVPILSEQPQEPGLTRAVRFPTPAGHVLEVFTGMHSDGIRHTGAGIQPRKFGHPMLCCEDTRETVTLFTDLLDFRISDDVGEGTLVFMRCGVDHHGMGVGKGPRAGLNHYAWEVRDLGALGSLGDVLARNGSRFIWGPGRHGAGENLFTYHFDPAGCIVEYYADLYQVWDEPTFQAGQWSLAEGRFENLWGPGAPAEMTTSAIPVTS